MAQVALIIREKGSSWAGRPPVVAIFDDEAEARAALFDYVCANWEDEMFDADMPEDSDDAVDQYFEVAAEAYDIAPMSQQEAARC